MKNYFFCVVLFFIVSSCGIFGDEKVVPNENAVLSGPPLAIPPDFDIDSSLVDNTGIPTIDIIGQEDNENFANIPTLDQETPYVFENSQETIEMLDSGTIQAFETYDPINQQVFVPQQKGNNETKFSYIKNQSYRNIISETIFLKNSKIFVVDYDLVYKNGFFYGQRYP